MWKFDDEPELVSDDLLQQRQLVFFHATFDDGDQRLCKDWCVLVCWTIDYLYINTTTPIKLFDL